MFMKTCFSVSGWLTGLKEQYRPVVRPNKRTVFRMVGPVGPIKRTAPTSLRKIPHSLRSAGAGRWASTLPQIYKKWSSKLQHGTDILVLE